MITIRLKNYPLRAISWTVGLVGAKPRPWTVPKCENMSLDQICEMGIKGEGLAVFTIQFTMEAGYMIDRPALFDYSLIIRDNADYMYDYEGGMITEIPEVPEVPEVPPKLTKFPWIPVVATTASFGLILAMASRRR